MEDNRKRALEVLFKAIPNPLITISLLEQKCRIAQASPLHVKSERTTSSERRKATL